jgi:hypothetical protein
LRQTLYFSASDGSDSMTNGRRYDVETDKGAQMRLLFCRAELLVVQSVAASIQSAADEVEAEPEWPRWLRPTVRYVRLIAPAWLRTSLHKVFLTGPN